MRSSGLCRPNRATDTRTAGSWTARTTGWATPVALLFALAASGCSGSFATPAPEPPRPQVVVSSSLLYAMVHSLAGPETELYLLVPAGSCPGHYDLAPADALAIQRCDLALTHAFQKDLRTRWTGLALPGTLDVLADRGSALIPDNYRAGLAEAADVLARRFPRQAPVIRSRHVAADDSVRRMTLPTLAELRRLGRGVAVVCDSRQAEFLRFLGIEVRGTWLAGADPSPELIRRAPGDVDLLVGNRQSDQAGITGRLAEQWGRPHVVLSNFPTDPAQQYDYLAYFQSQTRALREALSHVRPAAR